MFERFTADARAAVAQAQDHARRLGHAYIGSEHLLLGLVAGGSPAATVLREHRLTPENVEEQIVRAVGLGGPSGRGARLDRDALAAMGIDLDQVSAVADATFGEDALSRAGYSPAICRRDRRRRSTPGELRHFWRRSRFRSGRRSAQKARARTWPPATGRYYAAAPGPAGHLPFTARAKKVLERSLIESQSRRDGYIGAQHLALAVLSEEGGIIPVMLSALDISPAAAAAAVNDRYREAG